MNNIKKILDAQTRTEFATTTGVNMHAKLQCVIIDGQKTTGDSELVAKISSHPELLPFFTATTRTEVPIAGNINNRFISRRIDRLCIDTNTHRISILDYKTDTDRKKFYKTYQIQLSEYAYLLRMIYPGYKIATYILWTHDFSLENIPEISL